MPETFHSVLRSDFITLKRQTVVDNHTSQNIASSPLQHSPLLCYYIADSFLCFGFVPTYDENEREGKLEQLRERKRKRETYACFTSLIPV